MSKYINCGFADIAGYGKSCRLCTVFAHSTLRYLIQNMTIVVGTDWIGKQKSERVTNHEIERGICMTFRQPFVNKSSKGDAYARYTPQTPSIPRIA